MENTELTLYLELNDSNFIFFVCENDRQNYFKLSYKTIVPLEGIKNNRIIDPEKAQNIIKKNVYYIEQKFDFIFKEIVIILENFNLSFINLTGFKKLNGTQILKENVTYILNKLKSYVDETEHEKKILHIFNSNFFLDNKKIENLPIGLFGNTYSHELSFSLISNNDFKNIKNILDKCNLKIKKTLLKSFILGSNISNHNEYLDTFFRIKVNENNSRIFYFENNCLKFEQRFEFGTNIIINDICKITSIRDKIIKKIMLEHDLSENINSDELIEKEFFEGERYIKIKKKLIYEIAEARIKEISEILLLKNVNLKFYNSSAKIIFLEFKDQLQFKSLGKIFKKVFSEKRDKNLQFSQNQSSESLLRTANELVHYGWKREAIPVAQNKKSLIRRLFEDIFE